MKEFKRFAIYYAPREGAFSQLVGQWLGWDALSGGAVEMAGPEALQLGGVPLDQAAVTQSPRKYGFHGTLKAPFRLAEGQRPEALEVAVAELAASLAPVVLPGLQLASLGGFLALLPEETDSAAGKAGRAPLAALAAAVVQRLDRLRAPLNAAEIAKRRPEQLNPRQRALLTLWGYPYVLEEFRFHLTLSDALPEAEAQELAAQLGPWLAPVLPRPFVIEDLCLFGEDAAGRFHLISRHALTG